MGSRHTRVARCTGRSTRGSGGWCRPCAAWRPRMARAGVRLRCSNAWRRPRRGGTADHMNRRGDMRPALAAALLISMTARVGVAQADPPADDSHAAPRVPASIADWAHGARLFQGLGDFHRAVTSSSALAQQYFDQGMRLLWAFNHDESTRSFARAAELDPACAACYWGVALTVGPNYNVPAMEQPLISALAARYPAPQPPTDSDAILTAYAAAMRSVAERFPDDLDVQTLC